MIEDFKLAHLMRTSVPTVRFIFSRFQDISCLLSVSLDVFHEEYNVMFITKLSGMKTGIFSSVIPTYI